MSRAEKLFNQSLHVRLILIIIFTVGIFTSVFVLYGIKQTRSALSDQTETFGRSIAEGISAACSYIIYSGDDIKVQKAIESIGRSYEHLYSIEIFVANLLVAKYSSIDLGIDKKPKDKISQKGISYVAPIVVLVNGEKLELGTVKVTFSEDACLDFYMSFYIEQLKSSIISGFILLIVISGFLFLILDHLIVSPVLSVEAGAKIIAEGNLDHKIAISSKDEIGKLAFSFNQMTTRVKESKQEIEKWNQTLEKKVDERTQELQRAYTELKEAQYQLVQSGKMAAIGLMGAGIAHELNNPLVGIIGYVQLMLMKMRKGHFSEDDFAAFHKNLNYVEKESQRCKRIVDDLLNYSRESKKFFEPIDVRRTIEQTLSIMEFQLRKWHIKVSRRFPDEQVVVMGNADKLQQVYINFIANAHHAMPEGGEIKVMLDTSVEAGARFAQISFEDTGCGIPEDEVDKVFESFFSSQRDMNNLGLGLSISNQIVKDHKGKITVKSVVNEGTIFTVTIPMVSKQES
jgi:two-component system NtrC family sensor kinase